MPSPAEALQAASTRFVKNAKEFAECTLDGSPKSLLLTSAVMQKYHAIYKRAEAAKDPTLANYVREVSVEAAAYISTIFINHFKVKLGATQDGKPVLVAHGVNIPILDLMVEEVTTGKPNSLLLVKQFDDITAKNSRPELLDSSDVPAKAQAAAAVAVQDVRAMLKKELDFSLESFSLVDLALQRVKAIAELSPANKSTVVRASCEKYGSYIGEAIIKHLNGKWAKVKVHETVVNAIDLGSVSAMPSLIVQAILEGKQVNLGDKHAATVVQFLEIVLERRKTATSEGLFENLDTPGEMLKRVGPLAEEAVRIAKVTHSVVLDYSLFSLPLLDDVIAKERSRIDADRPVLTEENFQRARAFSLLPLGVYLGEVILRAHGGSWEDARPWPKLRQHIMKFDPVTVVAAFFRGQTAYATEKTQVATAQQYYQAIRPLVLDVLHAKLYGSGVNREKLLPQMGPDATLNDAALHFAEACLVFAYSHSNVELDFSENSLLEVDRMLDDLRKKTPEEIQANSAFEHENLIQWFGCYSGEVFRRALGGSWAKDASGSFVKDEAGKMQPGPNVAHLNIGGNRVFVLNKVGKFLRDGSGDSVAFLLKAVRSMIEQGKLTIQPTQ